MADLEVKPLAGQDVVVIAPAGFRFETAPWRSSAHDRMRLPGAVTPNPAHKHKVTPPPPDPEPEPEPPPVPVPTGKGAWSSKAEIMAQPMSGAAWTSLPSSVPGGGGNVSDQNNKVGTAMYGALLRDLRSGSSTADITACMTSTIGSEEGARWLAVGRTLAPYIISADLLDIRSGPIHAWLKNFMTRTLKHNNNDSQITIQEGAWNSGSNASAQQGFVHAALAAYLGDKTQLDWGWNGFRRYCGDRTSPHKASSNSDAWQANPADPVGIQNKGAAKGGCRLDGAISNDMSRGGENVCNPGFTQYPWVGLMGAVPAAVVFARAGYPAWTLQDSALKRAAEYLHSLGGEFYDASDRGAVAKQLFNVVYGLGFPQHLPVGAGQTIGFTDFTHPSKSSAGA